jgi:integrase
MIDRENYKLVMSYLDYRQRVMQNDPKTIRNAWVCLKHMLQWADAVPFAKAADIRKPFPEYLLTARNDGKSLPLTPGRMEKTLAFARDLFLWAKREHPGRFRTIREPWIQSLQVRRSAGAQSRLKRREFYTLDEVLKVVDVETPDGNSLRFMRDKAALAFLFISGMRDGAFVTLPVGAVDIPNRRILQLPELGVQTKNSKAAVTTLLPIPRLIDVVTAWDARVRTVSTTDPRLAWYTRLGWEGEALDVNDLITADRKYTGRITSLRQGLMDLCKLAGVEYKSPHKARHGHGVYGIKRARTMAELKALSQNMMHANIATTDGTYGNLVEDDVAAILSTFTP